MLYPCNVSNITGLPTLHVSVYGCKQVITYFNDNDKGLKVYRQKTNKSK